MKPPFTNARIVGAGVTYEQYSAQTVGRGHKDYVMSRGELVEFMRCPMRWRNGYGAEQSREMAWGSLIDCLVLTPEQFDERFAVAPETYPDSKTGEPKPWNWNATFCKEWREEHDGKQIIKAEQAREAQDALTALRRDEEVSELLDCSQTQVCFTATYRDKQTGLEIPLRTLVDLLPDRKHRKYGDSAGDLKTGSSADPGQWQSTVFNFDLHTQGALYLDVLNATGDERTTWRHVAQENFHPWQPALHILSSEFIELGRLKYQQALGLYAMCLAEDVWPGYQSRTQLDGGWNLIEPKPWMLTESADWPKFPKRETQPVAQVNVLEVVP